MSPPVAHCPRGAHPTVRDHGLAVSFVPRLFKRAGSRISVECFGGIPLIAPHPTDAHSWQFGVRDTIDRVLALVLVVLGPPLLVAAAIATWLSVIRADPLPPGTRGTDGKPSTQDLLLTIVAVFGMRAD